MFRITGARGFHVQAPNGVCVSVQFGAGNYCEHRDGFIGDERAKGIHESYDAELMIFEAKKGGRSLTQEWRPEAGEVAGWVGHADVLDALNWAANYKKPATDLEPALGGQAG